MNLNKNYCLTAFAIGVLLVCTTTAYKLGYSAKHNPQYIHIKYDNINNNLVKVLNDCGIQTTKDQQQALFERLKLERGNR